jgi:hypothetical protein
MEKGSKPKHPVHLESGKATSSTVSEGLFHTAFFDLKWKVGNFPQLQRHLALPRLGYRDRRPPVNSDMGGSLELLH